MNENIYTCSDCGCYFYESDALKISNTDLREVFCYKANRENYAKVLKREKRSAFNRYAAHNFLFVVGLIFMGFYAIGYYNNIDFFVDVFVPVCSCFFAISLVWFIVNLIRELRGTNKFRYVGIPEWEVETVTTTEYSDGSSEKETDTSYQHSYEQTANIIFNIFTFIKILIVISLFGWVKFLAYYVKYRKRLKYYFKARKMIKEISNDVYSMSTVELCEVLKIGKQINVAIKTNDEEIPFIGRNVILENVGNYNGCIYSCINKEGNLYYAKVLPGRKSMLVEDSYLISCLENFFKTNQTNEVNRHPFEMILDENCNENIVLYNEKKEAIELQQIAVIPYNEEVYAILKPIANIQEVEEDDAFVFLLNYDNQTIVLVEDENLIDVIFQEYDKLQEQ